MRLDKSSWCCCRSLAYAVIGRSTPQGCRYPDPKGPKGKLFALLQASDSAQDTLSGTHIDDERELMADGVSDVALLVPIPRFLHFQTKKHPHRKMVFPTKHIQNPIIITIIATNDSATAIQTVPLGTAYIPTRLLCLPRGRSFI